MNCAKTVALSVGIMCVMGMLMPGAHVLADPPYVFGHYPVPNGYICAGAELAYGADGAWAETVALPGCAFVSVETLAGHPVALDDAGAAFPWPGHYGWWGPFLVQQAGYHHGGE